MNVFKLKDYVATFYTGYEVSEFSALTAGN